VSTPASSGPSRARRALAPGLLSLALAAGVLLALPVSPASAAEQTIASPGPLTSIIISDTLNCQVTHLGDDKPEFFPPDVTNVGACGTLVAVGGTIYGPPEIPADATLPTGYIPVSQSAVTGAGTSADPFTVVTVVDAGSTGVRLTETDRYVSGQESYRTDVAVANTGSAAQPVTLYRAGDCFLQNSDVGNGFTGSPTGAVACAVNANNTPVGRIEQWLPLTTGSHYMEGGFQDVWAAVNSGTHFPDTCTCANQLDNGAGLSWDATIPAGGSSTFSHLTSFSPQGTVPLSTAKTADQATAPTNGSDGYTITVTNPNAADVALNSITDNLPAGFAYTAGSTTGATTTDPTVSGQSTSGQTLTWAGPFTAPAASGTTPGTLSLHFGVTVACAAGSFLNQATADGGAASVAPTGPTAPIVVTTTTTTTPPTTTTTPPGATTTVPATTTTAPGSTSTSTPGATTSTSGAAAHAARSGHLRAAEATTSTTACVITTTTTTPRATTTTTTRPTTTTGGGGSTTTTTRGGLTTTTAGGTNPLPRTGTAPLRMVLFGLILLASGVTLRRAEINLR